MNLRTNCFNKKMVIIYSIVLIMTVLQPKSKAFHPNLPGDLEGLWLSSQLMIYYPPVPSIDLDK